MNLPFQVDQEQEDRFKPPHLRFEDASIKDNAASLEAGRAIFKPVIKVFIRSPGDDKCEVPYIVEQKVTNTLTQVEETIYPWETHLKEKLHHNFIPRQYFDFCMKSAKHWKDNQETLVQGTPVTEWPILSRAEADNLKGLGILSIEQCSEMTEEAMTAYGMGGRAIKDKAIAYLGANTNPGKAAEKITSLESSLSTATEKAQEAMDMAQGYAAKIAQLEALMAGGAKDAVAKVTEIVDIPLGSPNYDNWEVDALVAAAKKAGTPNAHKGWSREVLISKIEG